MIRVGLSTLLIMGLAFWGCEPRVDKDVVATVDQTVITSLDLQRSLTSYGLDGEMAQEVLLSVLDDLINQALIVREAEALRLNVTPEELAQAEKEIREDYPDDSFKEMLLTQALDLQEWRRELKNRLLVKKTMDSQVDARLKVKPEEVDKVVAEQEAREDGDKIKVAQIMTQDRKAAEKALSELKAGGAFNQVALKYSILADQVGQETGYFGRGEMPLELEKAVWALNPGQTSKVVKSEYGWHVFILLDRRKGGVVDREEAAARIKLSRKAEFEASWLLELRNKAEIKIYPERLADLSAVLSRRNRKE